MTFNSQLPGDIASVFLNTDEMAETVDYRVAGLVPTKSITVVRQDLADTDQRLRTRFWVDNDPTLGIASPQRQDEIIDVDGTRYTVVDTSLDELGMFTLDCEALLERA